MTSKQDKKDAQIDSKGDADKKKDVEMKQDLNEPKNDKFYGKCTFSIINLIKSI